MDSNAGELRLASFGFPHDAQQDQTATPAPGRNLDAEPAIPCIPSNPFSRRYSPPLFLIPKEDGTGLRQLRVLFIHGFESGPKGRRSVALSRHFECYTPWMRNELEPILRWRQNRVVHACIALFVLLLIVACLAAYTSHHMGGLMLSIPALLVGLLATYWVVETVIVRFIAHPAIQGCLQKQRDAILTFKPDVVVGSSWGGGIATYLMMEGAWRGPTILLAPAGGLISRKARFLASSPLRIPDNVGFVHVVHSKIDRIVPAQDSVDLIQRSSSVVEGDEQQPTSATSDDQDMRCAPGRATSTNHSSCTDNNHSSSGRIRLTLIDDDDHPLSRAMREEKLREAVIEAYTFVHPRTK